MQQVDDLDPAFRRLAARKGFADFCSLRLVRERHEVLSVRQGVPQPAVTWTDIGMMVQVLRSGGMGYAAGSDLSEAGLQRAMDQAAAWADLTAGRSLIDFGTISWPHPVGQYEGPQRVAWDSTGLAEKFDLLRAESARLKLDDKIVDWESSLWHTDTEVLYLTSGGGRVLQRMHYLVPNLRATANAGAETQTRTLAGRGCCRQGGLELLDAVGFRQAAPQIADEALQLLAAPNCPSGPMDVLLAADQMILQVHESIGHPLELDRILGDERNYAGTSFVTLDMLGSYRYGSDLLNVTFDPTRPEQFATFAYDDDGLRAEKVFLIRGGILLRALGGLVSQGRSGKPGVANSRACGWNRPPIDRMANLNVETGASSLAEMIASIDRGVYMKANRSWSIDDSRNKFQFGCEWAQMIEGGKLTTVLKNPNYRGISATFWRSLRMVGDESTVDVLGTPFCGKGEPNQGIRVGHASPACVFADVDVFGGE